MVTIEEAVDLARAAYYPSDPLPTSWAQLSRIKLVKPLSDPLMLSFLPKEPSGSDFGFVARRDTNNDVVISFRGTNPRISAEVLEDLDFLAARGYEAGFYRVYECCFTDTLPGILGLGTVPVTAVGHSLGGAMALIFGSKATPASMCASVFTFGAPKTFTTPNPALSAITTRVENFGDPIPLVPPIGYCPIGEKYSIAASGLDRHSIDNYQRRIRELKGAKDV